MPNDLLDTLLAQNRKSSARGNIDWLSVLGRCADSEETRELLRMIPSSERRALLAETGRTVYREDLGNFRAELIHNTEPVIASGQLPGLAAQREDHAACLFAALSDVVDLADRAGAEAHLAKTRIEFAGQEHLVPFAGQRGIILLGVYQSHFGYALKLLEILGRIALIRKPLEGEGAEHIPAPLLEWQDSLELIPADASGGIRLFQWLRRGGAVGLYNDFLYGDARPARGMLFGQKVPISRTLLRLIQSTKAVVFPFAVARSFPLEGSEVKVRVFAPLSASVDPDLASEAALAIQISIATEALIRRHPVQWRLWNTLRVRWEAGASLSPP
jgi:lauroyl/myristoyl acyltransferase